MKLILMMLLLTGCLKTSVTEYERPIRKGEENCCCKYDWIWMCPPDPNMYNQCNRAEKKKKCPEGAREW